MQRREVKSKGEKKRYKHLNAEFQRIARRDTKAFFSDQCKEIEENNRMGKTRDHSTSLVAQMVKHLSIMWETQIRSLGWEDLLEKEKATHAGTLA